MPFGGEIRLESNLVLGASTGGYHQHSRKTREFTSGRARIAEPVIGIQLGGVLRGALGTPIVLKEETESCVAAAIASKTIRPASAVRACSRTAPLEQFVVAACPGDAPRRERQFDKELVGADRVGKVAEQTPACG
jgi:hypothetical protein